jgi:hypothetical protein
MELADVHKTVWFRFLDPGRLGDVAYKKPRRVIADMRLTDNTLAHRKHDEVGSQESERFNAAIVQFLFGDQTRTGMRLYSSRNNAP